MSNFINICKLPPSELLKICNENKELVQAYMKGETIEHNGDGTVAFGVGIGVILAVFVLVIIIQVAIAFYIKSKKDFMDPTMYTVCWILWWCSWFVGGSLSIVALIIAAVTSSSSKKSGSRKRLN